LEFVVLGAEVQAGAYRNVAIPSNRRTLSDRPADKKDQELNSVGNCGLQAFKPRSPRQPHRGGTIRLCRSINGHGDINSTGATDTLQNLLSRASFWLLLLFLLFFLFLLFSVLFLTLFFILLALVSHGLPLLLVVLHVLAMRAPLRRHDALTLPLTAA
jgi:hypothetical protein